MIKPNIGTLQTGKIHNRLHNYLKVIDDNNSTRIRQYSNKDSKQKNRMMSQSRDVPVIRRRERTTSVASDAITAIMLISVYQQSQAPLWFPGAQASDLTVIQHSNAIINMYNNDACIHNIGCHERPIGHFIVSTFEIVDFIYN